MDCFEEKFASVFETSTLKGERVSLVGLKELDWDELFAKVQDSRELLEEHLPWVAETSPVDLKKRGRSWILAEQLGQGGCWQVYANCDNVHDGQELNLLAGFIMIDVNLKNHSATVSYWLFKDFTGRGLMTEALSLLKAYCFNVLELNRLELFASSVNKKSQGVAERCGFLKEGICRDFELKNGVFVDHVRYSLLARDP